MIQRIAVIGHKLLRYSQVQIYITLKIKPANIVLTLATILLVSSSSAHQKDKALVNHSANSKIDTVILKETFKEEDIAYNEYLAGRLKPIRKNFKRINSIAKWTSIDKRDLDESTEGGEATFFYSNKVLEKITTRYFGETFQKLTEYYLLNGQLSFVFEKSYKYNRPIYYDSTSMKENKDNEAFDFVKSEIEEKRSYFEKGKLVHQANNQDCGSPFADDYLLEEQNRLITDFKKLKILIQ